MNVNITETEQGGCPCVVLDNVVDLDIGKIFDCGQCFRFDSVPNSMHEKEFSGVAFGKFVSFAQDGNRLFIYGSNACDYENIWKKFLDIDRDYGDVAKNILSNCQNETLALAVEKGRGIRILSQDPFECIISFIVSQNNNIPRIKKIIEALCLKCGTPIDVSPQMLCHSSEKTSLCAFPTAKALQDLGIDGLFRLKTGFRAKYIYDAAQSVIDGRVSIDAVSTEGDIDRSVQMLCTVNGIGKKVASCALLFGFGKYNAFPVDVWMKRVAQKYFPEQGEDLSWRYFGEYAGIAQQYLFYYERYLNS